MAVIRVQSTAGNDRSGEEVGIPCSIARHQLPNTCELNISPTGIRTALRGTGTVGIVIMSNEPVQAALAIRPRDAARMLGISPRTLWEWTRTGIVKPVGNA